MFRVSLKKSGFDFKTSSNGISFVPTELAAFNLSPFLNIAAHCFNNSELVEASDIWVSVSIPDVSPSLSQYLKKK